MTENPEIIPGIYFLMTEDPEIIPGIYILMTEDPEIISVICILMTEDPEIIPGIYILIIEDPEIIPDRRRLILCCWLVGVSNLIADTDRMTLVGGIGANIWAHKVGWSWKSNSLRGQVYNL